MNEMVKIRENFKGNPLCHLCGLEQVFRMPFWLHIFSPVDRNGKSLAFYAYFHRVNELVS